MRHPSRTLLLPLALALYLGSGYPAPESRQGSDGQESGRASTDARKEIVLTGNFEPYESAMLYSMVTGYVASVAVDIGDMVQRDAVLVRLKIPEMEAELARAEAEVNVAAAHLREAKAQADLAGLNHRRVAELQAKEPLAVTQQDVDMVGARDRIAAAQVESAAAELEVARAELKGLRAMEAYSKIRAPFRGVISQRIVDPGHLVVDGANGGEPVLQLDRVDRLRLVLAIPEAVVAQIAPGLRVEFTVDALPDQKFDGTITRIAGALSEESRSMRAEVDVEARQGLLRPGMYATVRVFLVGPALTLGAAR